MNREQLITELQSFLDSLLKNGYCDSDVYTEPPTAIDNYLANVKKINKGIDSLYSGDVSKELETLIAELREVFPFPSDKDYDNGYDIEKKDGWCLSNIIASPKICLEMMIAVSDTLQSHPAPEISEGEIDDYLMEEIGDDPDELQLMRGIGMREGVKWAISKGAKPEVAHCTQCGYHYDSLLKECPTCKGVNKELNQ